MSGHSDPDDCSHDSSEGVASCGEQEVGGNEAVSLLQHNDLSL